MPGLRAAGVNRTKENVVHMSTQHTGTIAETGVPSEVDVVVVGSGGAGLMAALTAAKKG